MVIDAGLFMVDAFVYGLRYRLIYGTCWQRLLVQVDYRLIGTCLQQYISQ
jgi:hypothetical protein